MNETGVATINWGPFEQVEDEEFLLSASYDELMSKATQWYMNGNLERALTARSIAYEISGNDKLKSGHASRDISATYLKMAEEGNYDAQTKLGYLDEAELWLNRAAIYHQKALIESEKSNRQELRQISATEAQIAKGGLRKMLGGWMIGYNNPDLNQKTYDFAEKSQLHMTESKKQAKGINKIFDQWDINNKPVQSVVKSELGERKSGFWLGVHGLVMSVMSESPALDSSTNGLTFKERVEAKKKSFLRSAGAVVVSIFGQKADEIASKIV